MDLNGEIPVIESTETSTNENNTVTITFSDATQDQPGVFYVPVPTGTYDVRIIRKSKFPQNPKRSVRFSGKRTKRSVQKRKARNTQKAETKVL